MTDINGKQSDLSGLAVFRPNGDVEVVWNTGIWAKQEEISRVYRPSFNSIYWNLDGVFIGTDSGTSGGRQPAPDIIEPINLITGFSLNPVENNRLTTKAKNILRVNLAYFGFGKIQTHAEDYINFLKQTEDELNRNQAGVALGGFGRETAFNITTYQAVQIEWHQKGIFGKKWNQGSMIVMTNQPGWEILLDKKIQELENGGYKWRQTPINIS